MSKTDKSKQEIKRRPPLDQLAKETMVGLLLRNQTLYDLFAGALKTEHFLEGDRVFKLVWSLATEFYETEGKLPSYKRMMNLAATYLKEMPDVLTEEEREDLESFINGLGDPELWVSGDEDEADEPWLAKTIKRYRQESLIERTPGALKYKGQLLLESRDYLESSLTELNEIEELSLDGPAPAFEFTWHKSNYLAITATRISFIDDFLGGGYVPGEVYGIMGPFGSCKTTLAVMLATNIAENADALFHSDSEQKWVFLVTYESSKSELQHRLVSYGANIARQSLTEMRGDIKKLSKPSSLKDYEKAKYKTELQNGIPVQGEQTRAWNFVQMMNKRLVIVDMTGSDVKNAGKGGRGVREISEVIGRELKQRGGTAAAVIVDYVGAMARREMAEMGKDDSYIRHFITKAPLLTRNLIAAKYQCPVWLFHQLSGAANKKTVTQTYHYTDAAESASFAENLDSCDIVTAQQEKEHLCRFFNSKHRRTAGSPEVIIRIEGDFCRVVGTGDKYMLDPVTRTIRERSLVQASTSSKGKKKYVEEAHAKQVAANEDQDQNIPVMAAGDPYGNPV